MAEAVIRRQAVIKSFEGKTPKIAPSAFVSEAAYISGDVEIGEESGIWPGAILRADFGRIRIGQRTDIQDGCIIHEDTDIEIGDDVNVGHGAVLHCRRIGNGVLVGMHATILSGAEIGDGSIVAAGSVVTERTKIPPGSFVVGVPAQVTRQVREEEIQKRIKGHREHYRPLTRKYRDLGGY